MVQWDYYLKYLSPSRRGKHFSRAGLIRSSLCVCILTKMRRHWQAWHSFAKTLTAWSQEPHSFPAFFFHAWFFTRSFCVPALLRPKVRSLLSCFPELVSVLCEEKKSLHTRYIHKTSDNRHLSLALLLLIPLTPSLSALPKVKNPLATWRNRQGEALREMREL